MNTRLVYKREGEVVLDEELVVLTAWINQAQLGLSLGNVPGRLEGQEVWPARLADSLTERLKKPFTATEAYLLAVEVVKRMGELETGFSSGLQ
jgi:hypothetical protein